MAHMVLLGPLLDFQMTSFSFGNRWYRPISWDYRNRPSHWRLRPYPLINRRIYSPYSRAHGLFRRVAHWTVANMTNSMIQRDDYGGRNRHPEDYEKAMLPCWVTKDWWVGKQEYPQRAHWAALDLQLAYPSVPLNQLRRALHKMLGPESGDLAEITAGYPGPVLEALEQEAVRHVVADRIVDALEVVRIDSSLVPLDSWCPPHALPVLPPEKDCGLPTGLAISGILLNVILHSCDVSTHQHLTTQGHEDRSALVRFADDFVLLSRSMNGLCSLIDAVWRGLADDRSASIATGPTDTNLGLNYSRCVRNLSER